MWLQMPRDGKKVAPAWLRVAATEALLEAWAAGDCSFKRKENRQNVYDLSAAHVWLANHLNHILGPEFELTDYVGYADAKASYYSCWNRPGKLNFTKHTNISNYRCLHSL